VSAAVRGEQPVPEHEGFMPSLHGLTPVMTRRLLISVFPKLIVLRPGRQLRCPGRDAPGRVRVMIVVGSGGHVLAPAVLTF